MNYDITFCSKRNCTHECERNSKNVPEYEIVQRCGIWVANMKDCKYWEE